MAKIAFILLSHKDPQAIIDQAQRLTAAGDYISIHFDARSKRSDYEMLRAALDDNPAVTFAKRRVKCGWGEWSLVEGTLEAVKAAVEAFPRATHFYMISGDCMSIKSAEFAHRYLDENDVDYIESFDFFESDWIKTGFKEERLIYRHWFNERTQKWRFYQSYEWQKRLGLTRKIPDDIQVMIGSQWWCLRRRTIEWILAFIKRRRDVMRFFATTWIPDETFFQTLVRHLVPADEIRTRTLTFLMFTDYGMPVTFYNDHYDLLLSQDYLFARKISPGAEELRRRLGALYTADGVDFNISNEGRSLFKFVVGRGRIGQRFAPRFWEAEASLGRDRELLVVVAKKWHVGKRFLDQVRKFTDIPAIDYLFDEASTPLPDLGGIQSSLSKRTRHRRALMRMLFDYYDTDRMVIALDPNNMDLLRDFYADRSTTRVLEMECEFTDEWIKGHAMRVGLAGERTPEDTLSKLIPAIRSDFYFESDQIRDSGFDHLYLMRENGTKEENARAVSRFLSVPEDRAREIIELDHLFSD
ncbi:MAG: glycosyl transferase [Rhodobacterales bacterium]|nr:MAG: glycosyl transferase [Rhodobacterales bacterium]